jgi:16S rRNA (cytosine967-C5)-methyltransferase
MLNARHIAFLVLKNISSNSSYPDIALNRHFQRAGLSQQDHALVTELVYGVVRRQRTLDTLIDQLAKKTAQQQPPDLRLILQLGLYQLRFMQGIPTFAAVDTSVDLVKALKYGQLAGVVNGILRNYLRLSSSDSDPLKLPTEILPRLGIEYSLPDWIVDLFLSQFGPAETEQLCAWFNQTPNLDIRINPLKTTRLEVQQLLAQSGIETKTLAGTEQGLRLIGPGGSVVQIPGFEQGLWTVQDASAQQVIHFLDPQVGETIIDACAAPGGKTAHIAELMQDQGRIWAIDRTASRLKRLQKNITRLGLHCIELKEGDSRALTEFNNSCDRLLLDVPCSGLGTLHRNPDLRWQMTEAKTRELAQLQKEILYSTHHWLKPQGILVYSTCTLNEAENEQIINVFLKEHPQYSQLESTRVIPHHVEQDGFFMVKLRKEY